ncbi:transcriptional regulator [Streptomyces sp. 8K308]|uniref:ArsR/SmtB family transcription factor n=1 Tax=Streptomyces sp. 8K308 TaxID=2530388 RepID=UPI00104FA37C|nr:metalloregulator ArsR/SmtB family transcription factor [Streptomyces sp. 8K308]TDC27739.1 transcriptional regulator [Streptomyces sp. 8K308]
MTDQTVRPKAEPQAGREAAACCAPPGAADASPADVDLDAELSPTTHDFLKALASETRQQIMLLFSRSAELSVGEVAERAGLSHSAASQQLNLLRRGGIVTSRRDGKTVLYRADKEHTAQALAELQEYLKYCC